jgi:hypothetical protein
MSDLPRVRAFLAGGGADHRGRLLPQVLGADDTCLETTHDVIQWLFPLEESSQFNPFAPVLTRGEFAQLARDAPAVEGVLNAFERMLVFYGLQREGAGIGRAASWPRRAPNWAASAGHNDLRITRMLKCLVLLGQGAMAQALVDYLQAEFAADPTRQRALRHWRQALQA